MANNVWLAVESVQDARDIPNVACHTSSLNVRLITH
jgi:hypothetical protein